jgi:hypothetical protein
MIDLPPPKLLRAEAATLLATFANVSMITFVGRDGHPEGGNIVLFASNGPLPVAPRPTTEGTGTFDRAAIARLVAGAEPLRDDYAPVDQLQTRPS